MNKRMLQLLEEGLETLGVGLDSRQMDAILLFGRELELWNSVIGLTGAKGEELIQKHFLDSLAAVPIIQEFVNCCGPQLVDLGAGNGFPGIVLQIAIPELNVTLLERSQKRCGFLQNVAALLPQFQIQVQQQDLSRLQGNYDIVTSRAFRPLQDDIVADMKRITKKGGVWALYKGDPAAAQLEAESAGLQTELMDIQVPGLEAKRCLAVFRW